MDDLIGFDAQATDAIGRVWLLMVRVRGPVSIWRVGEKVAEVPWEPVSAALRAAIGPDDAGAAVAAMLAARAGALEPNAIAEEFAAQAGAWFRAHWDQLRALVAENSSLRSA